MKMHRIIVYSLLVFCVSLCTHTLNAQTTKKQTPKLEVNPDAVNFIVMGDWGRNGEDHQKPVAAQMGKVAAAASVDFIISTGDNFYPLGVISEFDPSWKYSFEDIYTAFSLQWDWYPVLGNHDYGSNPDAQVAYSKISRRWRMPSRYYSKKFVLNGDTTQQLLIAFIDTNPFLKDFYTNSNYGPNVKSQDSTAQKVWLKSVLGDPSPNIKWKLVVGHHPMFTGSDKRREGYDTRNIRSSLKKLMEEYQVDAYLAGHDHSLQHIVVDGLNHFVSGAASEATQVGRLPQSKFAMSRYGFMLFSATANGILIQAIDEHGVVLYRTELKK
ncbi:MAG: acid phosphatase [Azospira oryzae]|nr:MAG: acid phosphatase [Azospira oryzae]